MGYLIKFAIANFKSKMYQALYLNNQIYHNKILF